MSTPTTTAATTNAAVIETAPEVKVKRTWKEFRQLVWSYCTFPCRKAWEFVATMTERAVYGAFVLTLVTLMGYIVWAGVAYAGFLGRIEASTVETHEKLLEANTPKSFGSWLYGVTITPAANADGYVRKSVGL